MTATNARRSTSAAVLGTALLLSACAGPGSATPPMLDELCAESFVIECETGGASTVVLVEDQTPADALLPFAEQLHAIAAQRTETLVLRAESSEPRTLDAEVAPPYTWEIAVTPDDVETLTTTVESTLDAASVPGAVGIAVIDGWAYVTVEHLDHFEDVFTRVSETPLFEGGGTYTLQSLDEHLRIVHVPARTALDAILEIIAIARDYPDAEVLLEAPTAGPQFPTFYVARLSPSQQQELDARLRDPRLASADVDGHPLGYVLGSTGESGTTYVNGTFGSVVD